MSSVTKSMVEPFRRGRETASTRMWDGVTVGCEKWLVMIEVV
jgi:hypothetical protein